MKREGSNATAMIVTLLLPQGSLSNRKEEIPELWREALLSF
jgi:hypothetical protein